LSERSGDEVVDQRTGGAVKASNDVRAGKRNVEVSVGAEHEELRIARPRSQVARGNEVVDERAGPSVVASYAVRPKVADVQVPIGAEDDNERSHEPAAA
jgi:hypothetical protein